MKTMLGSILTNIRAMLGPTSKSVGRTLLGSCWTKTKVDQDKDHVGVHIGQHQSDDGVDIIVMLGQDEGRSR